MYLQMIYMRSGARLNLSESFLGLNHDEILDFAYDDMKKSGDYVFLVKKYDPAIKLRHLGLSDYPGEMDIFALNRDGIVEITEVKSNGYSSYAAANQLLKRYEWVKRYKPIIEEHVFHEPFDNIETIICYQDVDRIVFQYINVNDKYWKNKRNEETIPDKVQYKKYKLGNYTVPKKDARKISKMLHATR